MTTHALGRTHAVPRWVRARYDLLPLLVIFAVELVIYLHYNSSLFTVSSIIALSVQFLPLILATMGQSVIMLVGGIDLSLGAALSLSVAILATRSGSSISSVLLASLLCIVVGLLIGGLTGTLVSYARLPPIIVTLATSFVWAGAALFVLPQPGGQVPENLVSSYNGYSGNAPIALAIIVVALLIWKFIKSTHQGMNMYATGDNERGAFTSGLNVRRVKVTAYVLAGFFTAVAGIGLALETGSGDPNIGIPYTLNSITAAVLGGVSFFGGVGEMKGAVIGALVLGFLINILNYTGMQSFYQYILEGVVLIVAISLKAFTMRQEA